MSRAADNDLESAGLESAGLESAGLDSPGLGEDPTLVPTVNNPRRAIGLKMAVLARQLRQCFDERVERTGLTRAKWMLTAAVAQNPGATQRTIASKLEVTDVTAGRLIDRVCADGLVERRENAQDRRAYCLHLTPAAQPVLAELTKTVETYERDVFEGFSEEEIATFNRLLDKMSGNLCDLRREPAERRLAATAA